MYATSISRHYLQVKWSKIKITKPRNVQV